MDQKSRWAAIEAQARFLQLELWNSRQKLWGANAPLDPLGVLEPGVAFALRRYRLEPAESLEETTLTGASVQIAGQIDRRHRVVQVSTRFPREVQYFTAAHELGHIVLDHKGAVIHRDRPFEATCNLPRAPAEREADAFAGFFLVPTKLLTQYFKQAFGSDRFVLDESTAFALCTKPLEVVLHRIRSIRDLSLALTSTFFYGGRAIVPPNRVFGVSRTAMAIRLEEAGLIADPRLQRSA